MGLHRTLLSAVHWMGWGAADTLGRLLGKLDVDRQRLDCASLLRGIVCRRSAGVAGRHGEIVPVRLANWPGDAT